MVLKTSDGLTFYALPDSAKCGMADKSPECMDKCPLAMFDTEGEICIPTLCDQYEEGEKK